MDLHDIYEKHFEKFVEPLLSLLFVALAFWLLKGHIGEVLEKAKHEIKDLLNAQITQASVNLVFGILIFSLIAIFTLSIEVRELLSVENNHQQAPNIYFALVGAATFFLLSLVCIRSK